MTGRGSARHVVLAVACLLVVAASAAPSKYKVLDVEQSATAEQLRRQYIKLSKEWHPDKNPAPEATAKFQQISDAYATLSNENSRAEYDRMSFLYDLPQVEMMKEWTVSLNETLNQLPLYTSVVNAISQPPHKGIPELLFTLAGVAGTLAKMLPGSSQEPWDHTEEALAKWLQLQAQPGLDKTDHHKLAAWWCVVVLCLVWMAVWPKWPALILMGDVFMLSYAERLGVGKVQREVPEGLAISGLAVLHMVLVIGLIVGAAWLLVRWLQLAWACGQSFFVASVVGALSTPAAFVIVLQASLVVRIIMWNPFVGLPGPVLLLLWLPDKRKIPYWIAIYLLRPFAMFGAVLWLVARSIFNGHAVTWKRHQYITFFAAATYRLLWQLPAWLAHQAARWTLLGAAGTLWAVPWHFFKAAGGGTIEASEDKAFPVGTYGDMQTTGQALQVGFVYVGTALTVVFMSLDIWLNGLPPFLRPAPPPGAAGVAGGEKDGNEEDDEEEDEDEEDERRWRQAGGRGYDVRKRSKGGNTPYQQGGRNMAKRR